MSKTPITDNATDRLEQGQFVDAEVCRRLELSHARLLEALTDLIELKYGKTEMMYQAFQPAAWEKARAAIAAAKEIK